MSEAAKAFTAVEVDRLFDNLAQSVEDRLLVVTVTAPVDQAWGTADVALILIGPFDNLHVPRTVLHFFDS
jgi:hypothetical protein